MKGKKCLGHLSLSRAFSACLLLLLSLLFSLFPANKASAITYTVDLQYQRQLNSGNWNFYYRYGTGSLQSASSTLSIYRKGNDSSTHPDEPVNVVYMCSTNSYDIQRDDIINVQLFATITDSNDSVGSITEFNSADNFSILNISTSYSNQTPVNTIQTGTFNVNTGTFGYAVPIIHYPNQYVVYDVFLRATSSGNFPVCIGRNTTNTSRNFYQLPAMNLEQYLSESYTFKLSANYYAFLYTYDNSSADMNEKDNQDRDNLENQKSESEDSSDDSQEDAENTGTTLLAAFSSFVSAITSASPSNCNILMNMGNLNLGNVDLCQLSLPLEFQAIASIFMILFCVPLSIATARKVINLFRSFQS